MTTRTATSSSGTSSPPVHRAILAHLDAPHIRESDAIIVYLVDKYDTGHKVSASTDGDKYKQLQWLFFQSSGQGPYFGQAAWFTFFHPEKIPSAQERYKNEIVRVLGVLEDVLSKQEWLVGGKATVSDLSFIPYVSFSLSTRAEKLNDVIAGTTSPSAVSWRV